MRIGLVSDTHIPVAARELWPQVYEALRGATSGGRPVDLIMHAGDLMVPEVIDWLEEVAPVMAVQGTGITHSGFLQRRTGPLERGINGFALEGSRESGSPGRIIAALCAGSSTAG